MISIRVELDGKYMNAYWADGLIVSTPTGSTAYSLSCGGPIVTPGCMVHIITPIAPHNLNVRPVLIPDFKEIRLVAECRSKSLLLTLDSRSKIIKNNYEIIVRKAKFCIKVIQFEDYNFVDTIRDKLLWGLDKRN
jgi:NAD+ kinase